MEITLDILKNATVERIKRNDGIKIRALLSAMGVIKVSELKPSQYTAYYNALDILIPLS